VNNYDFLKEATCHEETEQAQGAKALEQVEAWDKAAVAAVEAVAVPSALVETAFVRTAVKECPTSWESLALRKSAPSAGRR
jgi:hypothetical protein